MTPGLQRVAQKKQSFFDSSDFPDDLDLLRGGGSLASKEPELKEQSMGSHKDNGAHFRFDLEPGAWMFSHMDTGGFELKEPINSQSHFHEGASPKQHMGTSIAGPCAKPDLGGDASGKPDFGIGCLDDIDAELGLPVTLQNLKTLNAKAELQPSQSPSKPPTVTIPTAGETDTSHQKKPLSLVEWGRTVVGRPISSDQLSVPWCQPSKWGASKRLNLDIMSQTPCTTPPEHVWNQLRATASELLGLTNPMLQV